LLFCGYNIIDATSVKTKRNGGATMENGYETYVVFTKKIAFELRKLGYKIIKTEPNVRKPESDVYIFKVKVGFFEDLKRLVDQKIISRES
jgi:hypothetical protein